ncbi:MAG: MarR family transcriptional regulator [Actinobacteria bacterium]|nr:MarR family transcriptional regulator [Actinomycetota bacterium]
MTTQPVAEQSETWEVADRCFELIGRIIRGAEALAQELGIPVPFVKALHILDCPLAMKELGRRMHCDASFVTLVADMLEKRGLARREPNAADRRVKNLVLTEDGVALKRKIEAEITARMPWNTALDANERSQLLALIRKMLSTDADGAPVAGADTPDAMHGELATLLVTALHDSASQERSPTTEPATPPTARGR